MFFNLNYYRSEDYQPYNYKTTSGPARGLIDDLVVMKIVRKPCGSWDRFAAPAATAARRPGGTGASTTAPTPPAPSASPRSRWSTPRGSTNARGTLAV